MIQDRKLQAQRLSDNAPIVTHGRLRYSLFGYHVHRRRAGHRAWDWNRSWCCLSRGRLERCAFSEGCGTGAGVATASWVGAGTGALLETPEIARVSNWPTAASRAGRRANRRLLLFKALWQFCHQLWPPM